MIERRLQRWETRVSTLAVLVLAVLVLAALVLAAPSARAHRLDEYLEQTLIGLETERITIQLDLTPGVAVAEQVLAVIDSDHDGVLSVAEQADYAERVRRDLALDLNGAELPLRLIATETSYPSLAALRAGLGTIALSFEARTASQLSGRLRFVNHHARGQASYLANCLLPRGAELQVLSQTRSPDQTSIELEIGMTRTPRLTSGLGSSLWFVGLLLVGALVAWGYRRAFPA